MAVIVKERHVEEPIVRVPVGPRSSNRKRCYSKQRVIFAERRPNRPHSKSIRAEEFDNVVVIIT